MDAFPLLWLTAKFILLLAGLLGPGAAVMHAMRIRVTVATSFAGSTVALYTTVLALQFSGMRISPGSLAGGLTLIAITTTFVARLGRGGTNYRSSPHPSLLSRAGLQELQHGWFFPDMGWWTPLYLAFWVAVVWRCVHEPLAGPDIEFRWSFLAEQMLRLGSLDFYPPRSAESFFSYFWVESIPPGAAALHAWAYACAGGAHAAWTVPVVVLQIWSLHEMLWRTAERIGGISAARFACLAAVACPLLTWSMLLGQETGLTALSLAGIAFALHAWQHTRESQWAFLAGVFAILGASAREYGLVFPALAAGVLIVSGADRRAWLAFLGVSVISVAWPLRTWALTGNPFYSLGLGKLFPINERFIAWIEHDATALGAPLHSAAGWRDIARYLLLFAPTALLGWFALAVATGRGFRSISDRTSRWSALSLTRFGPAVLALGFVVVVLVLWATSVRYTNGGLFYSLRVTSPALAIGALAAGVSAAAVTSTRPRLTRAISCALALVVTGAVAATLALPRNPWRTPLREWPGLTARSNMSPPQTDETVAIVLKAATSAPRSSGESRPVVLADAPGFQRRFLPFGVDVIPLWSPQADWLFDRTLTATEAIRRWRESGVRHLIITKWQVNIDFFNQHSRWSSPPFHVQLIGETATTAVFAIEATGITAP
jgi:hypothetical protein